MNSLEHHHTASVCAFVLCHQIYKDGSDLKSGCIYREIAVFIFILEVINASKSESQNCFKK